MQYDVLPVMTCSDNFGEFYDSRCSGNVPETNYLFRGDFVNQGFYRADTFLSLLALKVQYPNHITFAT
jgi:hypothetical protein